jgi:hypothetical protein
MVSGRDILNSFTPYYTPRPQATGQVVAPFVQPLMQPQVSSGFTQAAEALQQLSPSLGRYLDLAVKKQQAQEDVRARQIAGELTLDQARMTASKNWTKLQKERPELIGENPYLKIRLQELAGDRLADDYGRRLNESAVQYTDPLFYDDNQALDQHFQESRDDVSSMGFYAQAAFLSKAQSYENKARDEVDKVRRQRRIDMVTNETVTSMRTIWLQEPENSEALLAQADNIRLASGGAESGREQIFGSAILAAESLVEGSTLDNMQDRYEQALEILNRLEEFQVVGVSMNKQFGLRIEEARDGLSKIKESRANSLYIQEDRNFARATRKIDAAITNGLFPSNPDEEPKTLEDVLKEAGEIAAGLGVDVNDIPIAKTYQDMAENIGKKETDHEVHEQLNLLALRGQLTPEKVQEAFANGDLKHEDAWALMSRARSSLLSDIETQLLVGEWDSAIEGYAKTLQSMTRRDRAETNTKFDLDLIALQKNYASYMEQFVGKPANERLVAARGWVADAISQQLTIYESDENMRPASLKNLETTWGNRLYGQQEQGVIGQAWRFAQTKIEQELTAQPRGVSIEGEDATGIDPRDFQKLQDQVIKKVAEYIFNQPTALTDQDLDAELGGPYGVIAQVTDEVLANHLMRGVGDASFDIASTTDAETVKRADEAGLLTPVSRNAEGDYIATVPNGRGGFQELNLTDPDPIALDRARQDKLPWYATIFKDRPAISYQAYNQSFAMGDWWAFTDAGALEPSDEVQSQQDAALKWKAMHAPEELDKALEDGRLVVSKGRYSDGHGANEFLMANEDESSARYRSEQKLDISSGNPLREARLFTQTFIYNKRVTGISIKVLETGQIPIGTGGQYLEVDPMRFDPRTTLFFESAEDFKNATGETYLNMWRALPQQMRTRLKRDEPTLSKRPALLMEKFQAYQAVKLYGSKLDN